MPRVYEKLLLYLLNFSTNSEISVETQRIILFRKFKMRRRQESQISNSYWQGKTTTLHEHHAFLYFSLPSNARLLMKMPIFTFYEGHKQAMTKFILFTNLDMVDRNSAPEEFACIWQSKRVGIITKETEKKNMNSLFHTTFPSWYLLIKNSL